MPRSPLAFRRLCRLRSLRARLLVVSIAIAVAAVATTAWITATAAAEQERENLQESLVNDGRIYADLATYGFNYDDWTEVDGFVRWLSDEYDRRIALTDQDGEVIVDSARLHGREMALPDQPGTVLDPANPTLDYQEPDDTYLLDEAWSQLPMTPTEKAARQGALRAVATCMTDAGVDVRVIRSDAADRAAGWDSLTLIIDQVDDTPQNESVYFACSETEAARALSTPTAAEAAAERVVNQETAACLTREQFPFTYEADGVTVRDPYLDDEMGDFPTYDECSAAAYETAYPNDGPAEPVLLYLGEPSRGLDWRAVGRGRTLGAAAAVAFVAIALTVLASRRVLRPVAALTTAAQRMEHGDLTQHVPETGHDELAGLARSFNSMADALADAEEQRQRLASDLAHELRTPLANIRGYIEAAQDGVAPPDADLLGTLHEEAMLLQHLIDDLQTITLAEAGRLRLHTQPLDLADLAAQVVAAHRAVAEAQGIELPTPPRARHDGGITLDADPLRLRQAVGNLVSNALRHTSRGGRVTVGVRTEGGDAVVQVADTGEGIAPDHLPHVFDRFWRADESRTRDTGGSGLGLAICRQLVEAHGGSVTAASTLGQGSTFTIRLPAALVHS